MKALAKMSKLTFFRILEINQGLQQSNFSSFPQEKKNLNIYLKRKYCGIFNFAYPNPHSSLKPNSLTITPAVITEAQKSPRMAKQV